MQFGWDGASYQGRPNVALLKQEGHSFVIEKVTGEQNYVNPYWSQVRDDARAAGVVFGSYDWVTPQEWTGPGDAQAAARDYLRVLGERQPGELLTVDFEDPAWASGPYKEFIEAAMQTYLYTLKTESGQPVIVYTGNYFLQETGADKWAWLGKDFLLWQAAPGAGMLADDSGWPSTPAPFTETTIHQHQWYATSPAVAGQFDRDRFRGTIEELKAYGLPGAAPGGTPAKEADVREPATDTFTAYLNDRKETIFVWNAGGEAARIDGLAVVDLGVSVVNKAGEKYDRSIQANVVQVWHDRKPPDAGATAHPLAMPKAVE